MMVGTAVAAVTNETVVTGEMAMTDETVVTGDTVVTDETVRYNKCMYIYGYV